MQCSHCLWLQGCSRWSLDRYGHAEGLSCWWRPASQQQQASAAAPTAEANSSEHASEDEPSRSEQLSGAAQKMRLEERKRGDKTNLNFKAGIGTRRGCSRRQLQLMRMVSAWR